MFILTESNDVVKTGSASVSVAGYETIPPNTTIPLGHRFWEAYQSWLSGGNTPESCPSKSPEALRAKWKQERQALVDAITVEVDGFVFDGDEVSQERMARTIVALEDSESILWVLADNTPIEATKDQLKAALRLAGQRQAEVWLPPKELT